MFMSFMLNFVSMYKHVFKAIYPFNIILSINRLVVCKVYYSDSINSLCNFVLGLEMCCVFGSDMNHMIIVENVLGFTCLIYPFL